MIFAITIICGVSGQPCIATQHAASPYPTREACEAAHMENRPIIADIAPQIAAAWGQRLRIFEGCDTLERIRRVVPDAFPDHQPEADT